MTLNMTRGAVMQALTIRRAAFMGGIATLFVWSSAPAQTVLTRTDEATGRTSVSYEPATIMRFGGSRTHINLYAAHNSDYQGGGGGAGVDFLYITLIAPKGETWRRGLYTDVSCVGMTLGRAAGMSVTEDNPTCYDTDWVWGWISIRQIEFDESGQITKLDVMFNQRRPTPTTLGEILTIRHNAKPQSFSITTGRKSIFGANQRTYFGDEADFRLVGASNTASFIAEATKQQWWIGLSAPDGQRLAKGRYETASGNAPPTTWRMDVAFLPEFPHGPNARWCPGAPGVLDIADVEYDAAGQLTALSATFQHACSTDRTKRFSEQTGVSGEIRFNR